MVRPQEELLHMTGKGLYCPIADVYLDPWAPVHRALITHAHSDHARAGSDYYLAHHATATVLEARLGLQTNQIQRIEYRESVTINGVEFTFFPAGHVPGSAQIRVHYQGCRWVLSGDYKVVADGVSTPFEPVECDVFISECTFGLPIFKWLDQNDIFIELHEWWKRNRERGITSVVSAYSLGKAQRVFHHLDPSIGPIRVHNTVWELSERLGIDQRKAEKATPETAVPGALLLVPPAIANNATWLKRYQPYSLASVSGWMAIRGMKRRRGIDKGFVLSDHADFTGLRTAIRETKAERVLLTHGYTAQFGRWLREEGIDARELGAPFGGDEGTEHE